MKTKVHCLLWTKKRSLDEFNSLKASQIILAGLSDGKIAVINVKGSH